jgi:hypothetical protein
LVNRYTTAPVRFVAGLSLLIGAFDSPSFDQEARRLEALSRLFAQNVRVYAYPMTVVDLHESLNGWVSAEQVRLAPPLGHLYAYLLSSNFIVPIQIPAGVTAAA